MVVTPATGVTGINVTGNLYASNAITTTNVFSTNVTATNVTGTSVIGTHYGVIAGTNTASASSLTLTTALGLTYGGTGQSSAQTAMNALAGAVTSGSYLRGNGTNVVMSAIQAGDVPTLNQNTSGSAGSLSTTYASGRILYGAGSGVPTTVSTLFYDSATGRVGIGTASPGYPLDVSGIIRGNNEIISTGAGAGQFRAISGNYGFFIRNDGSDSYLMHTPSGDPYGSYNANRPFRINNASALVTMGNGLSISGGSGYTLDVTGDINASNSLRIGGLIQPRLMSSGTFTGVTSFDTVTFDLVNYNVVEIRMTVYFNTTNQRIMSSQLLDTGGTVYSATESGWQMFYSTGGVAASGAGAYILNNTEIAGNGVGGFIVVIRLIGNMGISGSVRNHWEWTTTGCYAGIGASTTYGRATPYNSSGATMNRMRFNLSGGTMTGKYSIINYST